VRLITIVAIAMAIIAGLGATFYFLPVISAQVDKAKEVNQTPVINIPLLTKNGYRQVNVAVNNVKLVADVAVNEEQKTKGLAIKENLSENEAMLFVFATAGNHAFWMKDMKFPIDIIWMDSNKTVVHVEHSLEPCTPVSCQIYQPNSNSLYALETIAGFANKYNVIDGTKMQFSL